MCVNRVMSHCFVGLRDRVVSVHGMKVCVAPLILNLVLMAVSGQLVYWVLNPQHPLGGMKSSFCFWELNPRFSNPLASYCTNCYPMCAK